jgi:hypothetical protein
LAGPAPRPGNRHRADEGDFPAMRFCRRVGQASRLSPTSSPALSGKRDCSAVCMEWRINAKTPRRKAARRSETRVEGCGSFQSSPCSEKVFAQTNRPQRREERREGFLSVTLCVLRASAVSLAWPFGCAFASSRLCVNPEQNGYGSGIRDRRDACPTVGLPS